MTTKERLTLMDDIKRKNDAAWRKYAKQSRPGWTWGADIRRQFRPFDGIGTQIILAVCIPLLLVLFLKMTA